VGRVTLLVFASVGYRFITKHNGAMNELTITYPEGVVASFRLLPGYPQVREGCHSSTATERR
jgi:hypothetical protein